MNRGYIRILHRLVPRRLGGCSQMSSKEFSNASCRKRPAREIAGKLFEEDINNNLADEGMDQLLGVPVAEKANT